MIIIIIVIDAKSAWNEMLSIRNFGAGNSKSNSLYWVASRPTISSNIPIPTTIPTTLKTSNSSDDPLLKSCSKNSACDAAGMIGDCCPTSTGIYLGCCPVDATL